SVAVLVVSLALLAISLATARDGRTIFGSLLGGDYAGFYVAGKILNEFPSDRLYDRSLQSRLFHELMPAARPEESLPFANPPFIAMLFRPLALLPYRWSYVAWLIVSAVLYVAGVWMLRLPAETFWLALSFEPLIMEGWIGGQ